MAEFKDKLARNVPLPEATPRRLMAIGERFTRAADVLVAADTVGIDDRASDPVSDAARLERVSEGFEGLVRDHVDHLKVLVPWAVERYEALVAKWSEQRRRQEALRLRAILKQLRAGRLLARSPAPDVDEFEIGGWFPKTKYEAWNRSIKGANGRPARGTVLARIETRLASAAVPAVERLLLEASDPAAKLPALKRPKRDAVRRSIIVTFRVPKGATTDPEHPSSTSVAYLRGLGEEDRLALSFARLAALRDLGSVVPLYDWFADRETNARERTRRCLLIGGLLPVADSSRAGPESQADPAAFPPAIAEQMLEWAKVYLAPGTLTFDEKGLLLQNGHVTAKDFLLALKGRLDLFIAHVESWKRGKNGAHMAKDDYAGPLPGGEALWNQVSQIVGLVHSIALHQANPLTAEQRAALDRGEVVAQALIGPHRNFAPVSDVLRTLLFAQPLTTSPDGTQRVEPPVLDKLRRCSRLLGLHLGEKAVAHEAGVPDHLDKPRGWTQLELCEHANIKPTTFRRIRTKAGIAAQPCGGHGLRYTRSLLERLIKCAEAADGKRSWNRAAARWRQLLAPEGAN